MIDSESRRSSSSLAETIAVVVWNGKGCCSMALCYIYILIMFSDIPMCGACVLVYHDTSQHKVDFETVGMIGIEVYKEIINFPIGKGGINLFVDRLIMFMFLHPILNNVDLLVDSFLIVFFIFIPCFRINPLV